MSESKRIFEVLTTAQLLEVLLKEEEKLSGELKELRKFHKAAWEEYGSELCSTEMSRNENTIAQKILRIKKMKEIVSSRKLNGQMLKQILSDLDDLLKKADEMQISLKKDIEALNEEKTLFTGLLEIVSK